MPRQRTQRASSDDGKTAYSVRGTTVDTRYNETNGCLAHWGPKEEPHGEKSLGALGGLRLPWPTSLDFGRKSTKEFIADGGANAQCRSGTPANF